MNDLYFPAFETGGRIVGVDIILRKPRMPRAFGSVARMYDAWLRSGDVSSAAYLYLLNSSGARSSGSTDSRYAVRPASSNAVNFKKAADIPRFRVCRSHV